MTTTWAAADTVGRVSVEVPIPQLFDGIAEWGFGYLLTVTEDERTHLIALAPAVRDDGDRQVLRFEAGAGRAGRNVAVRPQVTIVFPPHPDSAGMSLVVDGEAIVDGDFVDVRPTWAVMHRKAPPPPAS
jgi:hypothetical protein